MHSMKGKIMIALIVSLMCYYAFVPMVVAQNASLNVEPPTANIDIDEELIVNITISDMPDPGLFGYELDLNFDPDYLNATSAEIPEGHFLTPTSGVPPGIFVVEPGIIDNTAGTVSFAVTLLAPEEGKTGSGILCTVTFSGKAEGLASLTLEDVVLADPEAHEIPPESYDLNDSEVTVIPEFSTMSLMLLLLTATGAILLLKRKSLLRIKI